MSVFNPINKVKALVLKSLYHRSRQAGAPRIQGRKKLTDKDQLIWSKIYKVVWMPCDHRRFGFNPITVDFRGSDGFDFKT